MSRFKATTGFEPVNIGFANQPLKPLGYVAAMLLNHSIRHQIYSVRVACQE